jgi:polyisoprenyl-phosphate glycosyltransferase
MARGKYFAVMAADLQEPIELIVTFFKTLQNEPVDVVIGARDSRTEPWPSKMASNLFWFFYRKFIIPDMPKGGVDVFGCNQQFRNYLLQLDESHSSLVALIFWMGFRRKLVNYDRQPRLHGQSGWTFRKKLNYLKDSTFSFSDAPIKLLSWVGIIGVLSSVLLALVILIARSNGWIEVPGYSATVLIVSFFGALNILGLGIIGTYAWRTYENTKRRPSAIVMKQTIFNTVAESIKETQ